MLIRSLLLYTDNLEAQYDFYIEKLGFELQERWNLAFCFKAGKSLVTFHSEPDKTATPVHFAFGIQNQDTSGIEDFLKDKVELIVPKTQNTAIVDFKNWKAKSIYFYDADSNIVEFIIRTDDMKSDSKSFDSNNIKGICEIGIPCGNCHIIAERIRNEVKIDSYIGESAEFIPMGNSDGLLILVQEGKKKWYPTDNIVKYGKLKATIQNHGYIADIVCENGLVNIE